MTTDHDPATPDGYGVHVDWIDAQGRPRTVPKNVVQMLHDVIGEPPADLEERAPIVTRAGRDVGLGPVDIRCEDGSIRHVDGVLPDDFPLGYHEVTIGGHSRRLIVSPGRCWLPETRRAWGLTVQLYAARSRDSWGVGDLACLRTLREWAEGEGAGFILVNPLHAVAPGSPQEASPYLPATRRFRNPLYLHVPDVPGAEEVDLADFAARGRALNASALIDRDAVIALKHDALHRVHDTRARRDEFEAWRAAQGRSLQEYAIWAALAGIHGQDSHDWDAELQRPDSEAVGRFAAEHADEISYQAWLQWALDEQLRAASGDLTVLQDLPIGVDGAGADAWVWRDELASGVTVGAPPDRFNDRGQDWGSPPLIPWRLRACGYEPFIESIRATAAGAGGLRIDHVMGLFRLWWVPENGAPTAGAYVRYPSADLLDIVALESHRAKATVVGEDLGTVEPGVRETLAEHAILSYRLLWFEQEHPREWPVSAMAAITTHDLPTVSGLWSGADAADQRDVGSGDEEQLASAHRALLQHLLSRIDLPQDVAGSDVVQAAHRLLAQAPSVLLSATLEDLVGEQRRPNLPGTTDRPNWCLPLPVLVDDLVDHPGARAVIAALRDGVR